MPGIPFADLLDPETADEDAERLRSYRLSDARSALDSVVPRRRPPQPGLLDWARGELDKAVRPAGSALGEWAHNQLNRLAPPRVTETPPIAPNVSGLVGLDPTISPRGDSGNFPPGAEETSRALDPTGARAGASVSPALPPSLDDTAPHPIKDYRAQADEGQASEVPQPRFHAPSIAEPTTSAEFDSRITGQLGESIERSAREGGQALVSAVENAPYPNAPFAENLRSGAVAGAKRVSAYGQEVAGVGRLLGGESGPVGVVAGALLTPLQALGAPGIPAAAIAGAVAPDRPLAPGVTPDTPVLGGLTNPVEMAYQVGSPGLLAKGAGAVARGVAGVAEEGLDFATDLLRRLSVAPQFSPALGINADPLGMVTKSGPTFPAGSIESLVIERGGASRLDLQKIPGAPGSRPSNLAYRGSPRVANPPGSPVERSADTPMNYLRSMLNDYLDKKDFYPDYGRFFRELSLRDGQIDEGLYNELTTIFGITSPLSTPEWNFRKTLQAIYDGNVFKETFGRPPTGQELNSMLGVGRFKGADSPEVHPELMLPAGTGSGGHGITSDETGKIAKFWQTGAAETSEGIKTPSFATDVREAGLANHVPFVVIDTHMLRLLGYESLVGGAANGEAPIYRFAQAMVYRLAQENGLAPHEVQSALWYGAKNELAHINFKKTKITERVTTPTGRIIEPGEFDQGTLESVIGQNHELINDFVAKIGGPTTDLAGTGEGLVHRGKRITGQPTSLEVTPEAYKRALIAGKELPEYAATETARLHAENGGATWNLYIGDYGGRDAYAVSVVPERGEVLKGRDVTPDQLRAFIRKNADLLTDHRFNVGTWYDEAANETDLDISVVLSDLNQAKELGRLYDQKAIFHLGTYTEIPIGGTGGSRLNPADLPVPKDRVAGFGVISGDASGDGGPTGFLDYLRSPTARFDALNAAKSVLEGRAIRPAGELMDSGQVRAAAAGNIAGGVTGAATAPEDATPEERAKRAVGFAIAGTVGGPRALQLARNLGPEASRADILTGQPRRVYHGTSRSFETPDPKTFDKNGLYGPAYYNTDAPPVASSYATERSRGLDQYSLKDLEREREIAQKAVTNSTDEWSRAIYQRGLDSIETQIAGYDRIRTTAPQVRAVDLPPGLRLLDADSPIPAREWAQLRHLIKPGELAELNSLQSRGALDGNTVYRALTRTFVGPDAKLQANRMLSQVGFDGIAYEGGKRSPILDEAGKPIEHRAYAIFGDSLPKIRNALSGREGGIVAGGVGSEMTRLPGEMSAPPSISRPESIRPATPPNPTDQARYNLPEGRGRGFQQYAQANLLLDPLTHARNVAGNLTALVLGPIEKAGAVGADVARASINKGSRTRFAGEIPAEIAGDVRALPVAFRSAIETLGKAYADTGSAAENAKQVARTPFTMLETADSFFSKIAEGGIEAAKRERARQGFTRDAPTQETVDYRLFRQGAAQGTGIDDKTDRVIRAGLEKIQRIPYAGPLLTPFIRTPYNVAKFELERSLLAAPRAVSNFAEAISKPKDLALAGETADRVGRLLVGGVATGLAVLAAANDRITGSPPSTDKERELWARTGRQAYSLRGPDDNWYSYAPLTGLALTLAATADGVRAAESAGKPGVEPADAFKLVLATAEVLSHKPFMDNVQLFMEFLNDTDKTWPKLQSRLERTAVGLVPGSSALRAVERATDPYLRDADGVLERIQAILPGFAQELPERRGAYGQPVENRRTGFVAAINPFIRSKSERPNAVDRELMRRTARSGKPVGPVHLEQRPGESDRAFSSLARTSGSAVYQDLLELFTEPDYLIAGEREKEKLIRGAISGARSRARSEAAGG